MNIKSLILSLELIILASFASYHFIALLIRPGFLEVDFLGCHSYLLNKGPVDQKE